MSKKKKIIWLIVVVIVAIQFIQPARNENRQVLATDINNEFVIPARVQTVLKTSCYDCHSNNTVYPWYVHIQPVSWYMANHINDGKGELNFSEFGAYSKRKQQHKLKSIAEEIKDGDMPLSSYTLIHKNARLSEEEKALVSNWVNNTIDSLSKN